MFLIWLLTCFAWLIIGGILSHRRDIAEADRREAHRRHVEDLEEVIRDLEAEIEDLKDDVSWLREYGHTYDDVAEDEATPDWPDEDPSERTPWSRRRSMSAKERDEWLKRQQDD